MKKTTTRILAVLMMLGICLSLCGCQDLDALRACRASQVSEDVIELYDGTQYKKLPSSDELYPDFTGAEYVYVTEEEVPLLLTTIGQEAQISRDEQFLCIYGMLDGYYYCRTDIYDSVCERIENGFVTDKYGYTYYDYAENENLLYELTSAQADAVNLVLTTQQPETLPAAATLEYDYRVDLYLYSSDHLFRRDTVDICYAREQFFLVDNGNSIYTVPEDLNAVFAQIMERELGEYTYL